MKKVLFSIMLLFCLSSITLSNSTFTKSNLDNEVNAPLALPNGVYFLCCENGHLNLYNLLGQLVGIGSDCGEISNRHCYKVILVDNSSQLKQNPTDPAGNYVLSLVNSLQPSTGSEHSGSFGELPTYYFLKGDIQW
jgi:hypothetical protein